MLKYKFHENPLSGSRGFSMQRDRQTWWS